MKMFSCVWLHFKRISEKYFLEFGEEEGKDKPRRRRRQRDLDLREIAIDSAIASLVDRRVAMIAPLVDRSRSIAMSGAIDEQFSPFPL